MAKKKFFIMGNGGSGTSMLQGLLNAHTHIKCAFEKITLKNKFEENNKEWTACFNRALTAWWGNKVPFEQFITGKWDDDEIKKIADHGFYIIWIVRRFERYSHKAVGHRLETYKKNWARSRDIYFRIKDAYPSTTIMVSFEDILLRPESELRRICDFLSLKYEAGMLIGTNNTGFKKYSQSGFNLDKL